jgi:hypothetical protein
LNNQEGVLKTIKQMRYILVFCVVTAQIIFCFFPGNSGAASAHFTPWSGYWWPYNWGGLATGADYRGHPAPLEKYLLLTTGQSNGALISWYKSRYYDPNAVDWSGLCPYWARAAMMETYNILPSSEENIIFRVGDKKGLLTLCHDADLMESASGSNPVDFHRWLLLYIGDRKTSFTADLDAGEEVWFFPIYRYDMSSSKSGLVESISVKIYYATDNVSPDYIGTAERRKDYTYDLFLNSSGEIINGKWTGNSVTDHPHTMAFPLSSEAKSPYIDYDEVRRIARSKDDYLEAKDNAAIRILPGAYHLILLNEDQYLLNGLPGDEAVIEIVKDNSSKQAMTIDISNHFGNSIINQALPNGAFTYQFILQDPPYTITLSQQDYNDPNIYTLTVDQSARYRQNVPFIPKTGEWIGFAITNASDEMAEDVMLITCSPDGSPLQTVWGPKNLNPGEKHLFNFNDLPWRIHEYKDTDSLVLMANHPVSLVNLFGMSQQAMAGFAPDESKKNHIVIPDVYDLTTSPYMKGAIINELFEDAEIVVRLYSADGELGTEVSESIPPSGKYAINPGQTPFYHIPDGGWIDIVSTYRTRLTGYQYIKNKRGKKDILDTLFALPVRAGVKVVPHITEPMGRWNTFLTIINPNNKINSIRLHPARAGSDVHEDVSLDLDPFEKRIIDLSSDFGKIEGEPLYHSILEISGNYPISGYYTFSPSQGGDDASCPLLDENAFKSELVMPHHAGGDGRWWTGVGICNPNQIPVQILITPYDRNGEEMEELSETIQLSAGAYDVFNVGMKYGNDAFDIAYMKMTAVDPDDLVIGGFYLYGNQGNQEYGVVSSLSGANM